MVRFLRRNNYFNTMLNSALWTVRYEDVGLKLDRLVAKVVAPLSRSAWRIWSISEKGVNDEVIKNVSGLVYLCEPGFSSAQLNCDITVACSDV